MHSRNRASNLCSWISPCQRTETDGYLLFLGRGVWVKESHNTCGTNVAVCPLATWQSAFRALWKAGEIEDEVGGKQGDHDGRQRALEQRAPFKVAWMTSDRNSKTFALSWPYTDRSSGPGCTLPKVVCGTGEKWRGGESKPHNCTSLLLRLGSKRLMWKSQSYWKRMKAGSKIWACQRIFFSSVRKIFLKKTIYSPSYEGNQEVRSCIWF